MQTNNERNELLIFGQLLHKTGVAGAVKTIAAKHPETGGTQGKTGEQTGEQLHVHSARNCHFHREIAQQFES